MMIFCEVWHNPNQREEIFGHSGILEVLLDAELLFYITLDHQQQRQFGISIINAIPQNETLLMNMLIKYIN